MKQMVDILSASFWIKQSNAPETALSSYNDIQVGVFYKSNQTWPVI